MSLRAGGTMRRLSYLAIAAIGLTAVHAARQPPANPDALALQQFTARIENYIGLRDKLSAQVPQLDNNAEPSRITAHQRILAERIRQGRRAARPGDLFTPDVQGVIRRLVKEAMGDSSAARGTAMDENPGTLRLRINGPYPHDLPASTMPPAVLSNLPRLPDSLEYRFVGRSLILRDTEANLVLDYIPEVF